MTEQQKKYFFRILDVFKTKEFHHGDCIGADFDAHQIAHSKGIEIVIHPPEKATKRANCAANTILEPKPYLVRNHDIVDSVDILIATPGQYAEELRSGTWATIRYANKNKKRIFIIYPDGDFQKINMDKKGK